MLYLLDPTSGILQDLEWFRVEAMDGDQLYHVGVRFAEILHPALQVHPIMGYFAHTPTSENPLVENPPPVTPLNPSFFPS